MGQTPYSLDAIRRPIVRKCLQEVCCFRGWTLLAAHVRTNHLHVVLSADCKPEHVMTALKAYSSRELNGLALDCPDRRRWGRHGSTRYLWTREAVEAAIHYVVCEQGEGRAVLESGAALADARGSVAS
jgi:REP element-mobilizing transposase RayT